MNFSAVVCQNGKEKYRSKGLAFEKALKIVRAYNKANQDFSKAYVEETASVKHLPVESFDIP
jgi:hypothetical protein